MKKRAFKSLWVAALIVASNTGGNLTSKAMADAGSQLLWTAEAVAEREKALKLLGRDGFAVIGNAAEEKIFLNRLEQAGIKLQWAQHLRTAAWANFAQGMQVVCWRSIPAGDKLQINGSQLEAGKSQLILETINGQHRADLLVWNATCAWIPRAARLEVPGPGKDEIWTADTRGRDVSDGLQARLEVKQPAIQPGEDIVLTMSLSNVRPADGGSEIRVWDNRYSEGYRADFYLVVMPDGQSRILRRAVQGEWRKNIPTPIVIQPGESWTLSGIVKGDGIVKSLKELGLDTFQKGIYTVTGYYEANAANEGNADRARPFWGGQIATPPVEIRVGEGDFKAPSPVDIRSVEVAITEANNGGTIQATVGQEVCVSLKGEQKQTGWEVSQAEGEALFPVTVGGSHGNAKTPAMEFAPEKLGEPDIGTYSFRYKAVAPGTSKLRFVYVYPGGSRPTPRTATKLVREFSVTVEVSGDVAPAADIVDAKRSEKAPVVLRVKLIGTSGADKYAWHEVEILEVLKNESEEAFGRTLKIAAYSWKPGVPEGESTVYLERYNATDPGLWKLAGGEAATGVSHATKGMKSER